MKIPDWTWILKWKILYPLRHGHSYQRDYELAVRNSLSSISGHEFWDVGANTGYYALMLAKNFDKVKAFEPNPAAVDIMRRKIAKNHHRNVQIIPVALSDSIGRSKLYLQTEVREKTIGSSNSLIPSAKLDRHGVDDSNRIGSVPFVEVETDMVDNLLGNGTIDLMKIDVEGAEFLVLGGAKKALEEGRICHVMIELHDERRKRELESFLEGHHYLARWLDYVPGSGVSRVLATFEKPS